MMTPQLTTEAFAALGAPDLVYIRPISAKDVLGATPVDAVQGFEIAPDQTLYAVHRADGERLAILADALEDTGCTDTAILEHLRGPGPHVRGCFVIDALLGKE